MLCARTCAQASTRYGGRIPPSHHGYYACHERLLTTMIHWSLLLQGKHKLIRRRVWIIIYRRASHRVSRQRGAHSITTRMETQTGHQNRTPPRVHSKTLCYILESMVWTCLVDVHLHTIGMMLPRTFSEFFAMKHWRNFCQKAF
eukprot:Blabericola_migrator_1__9221@NODE_4947_length_924_cov_3_498250_g3104_i0_p2_GENE_NODE_4947_length_924_cov_3_498250_g3104_i0NODE_4947_length_924_cov_3_498250_g3104_i0_p2_ORF_typecomplete_len144_score6_44Kelch_2/PF07646_15/0_13_NODE_4947_length_924_cov_3_498250_g3104_i0193624